MDEQHTPPLETPDPDPLPSQEQTEPLTDDAFAKVGDLSKSSPLSIDPGSNGEISMPVSPGESLNAISPMEETHSSLQKQPEPTVIIKRGWAYYGERLMFIGACSSLMAAVLWLATGDRLRQPQVIASGANGAVSADAEFANYIQRALGNIDRQGSVTEQALEEPTNEGQIVERIYIPVYPPTPANGAGGNPALLLPPADPSTLPPPPAPPVASVTPPQPKATASLPVLTPLPTSIPATTDEPLASVQNNSAMSTKTYTLVGLLEAGDRTEALFKIDGTTQRFNLGDPLGTEGWQLLTTQNNQVILQRGNQTDSIYVGQDFSTN